MAGANPPKSRKSKQTEPDPTNESPASPTSGKSLLKQVASTFRRSSKPDEPRPPSASRTRAVVEVSLPARTSSLLLSSQPEVVPPPPAPVRRDLREFRSRRTQRPAVDTSTVPRPSGRIGASPCPSQRSPFDISSAPSLPPPSPYASGSGLSLASTSVSSFASLTPESPLYALELQRLTDQYRRSQESLAIERQAVREQEELLRRTQEVFSETERRYRDEVAALRRQLDGGKGGKGKRGK